MAGPVFVTGASGFVGTAVVEELLRRGHEVTALVHRRAVREGDARVRSFRGDLTDAASLASGLAGCAAAIHLVGIIREKPAAGVTFLKMHTQATAAVVDAARRAGVKRLVHMSALGTRKDAASEYHRTKWLAEECVRGSGLDWTILRPSLIHGPGGELTQMAAKWARRQAAPYLFMPFIGRGLLGQSSAKIQPVYVNDVARAFVDAIGSPATIGKTYELAGPEAMTWPQFYRMFARAVVGKPRPVLGLPAWKAMLLARVLPAALLPFNRAQVAMSVEDNVCDMNPFQDDFGWQSRGVAAALAEYAGQL